MEWRCSTALLVRLHEYTSAYIGVVSQSWQENLMSFLLTLLTIIPPSEWHMKIIGRCSASLIYSTHMWIFASSHTNLLHTWRSATNSATNVWAWWRMRSAEVFPKSAVTAALYLNVRIRDCFMAQGSISASPNQNLLFVFDVHVLTESPFSPWTAMILERVS